MMTTGLVLIDIQQDYFPNGRMEVVNAEAAAKKAGLLLDVFRELGQPIVHIQHISTREGAGFFLPGTKGAEIHTEVAPMEGEKQIMKHYPNSFRNTELENHLQQNNINSLIICGMMSHMCIDATVRAAFDKGFVCTVAYDACATRNLSYNGVEVSSADVHAAYMAALAAVYAKVISTDKIMETPAVEWQ